MNKNILLSTTFILAGLASPSFASMEEFWAVNEGIESGGDYAIMNDEGCLQSSSTCNSSAFGRHQIIFSNWKNEGLVEGSGWHDVRFTEEANQYGVNTVDDLRYTDGGHAMQDDMAGALAIGMYNGLNSNTTSYIGQTVNGVTVNEAALLRGAWHLGPADMNSWASGGFTTDSLRALDPDGSMLAAQGYSSYEDWNASLMNQMAEMGEVDISELTNGTYVVGGGEYSEGESLEDCLPEVNQALAEVGRQKVENVVALAQDQNLGFSQMEEPMGVMSCIDFAFSGSVDILFQVPNLSSILQGLQDFACQKLNQMTGDAMSQMTSSLQEVTSIGADLGFGPIQNLGGVQVDFNQGEDVGVNVGIESSNPTFSGIGSLGGSGGGLNGRSNGGSSGSVYGTGINSLFRQ